MGARHHVPPFGRARQAENPRGHFPAAERPSIRGLRSIELRTYQASGVDGIERTVEKDERGASALVPSISVLAGERLTGAAALATTLVAVLSRCLGARALCGRQSRVVSLVAPAKRRIGTLTRRFS